MKKTNLIVAGLFMLLGIGLVVSATRFPEGVGGLPGAGFFPQFIGGVIVLLAIGLGIEAIRADVGEPLSIANPTQILGAGALLFIYLLLWGTGLFPLRTAIFLAIFLRFLGQQWRAAATVSVVLTAVVTAAFQYGLNVSLE